MRTKIKLFCSIVMQINTILNQKEKRNLFGMFFLYLIVAFFEMLGVTAIIPFISALLLPEQLMKNRYLHGLIILVGVHDSDELLMVIGGALIAIYLAKNIILFVVRWMQNAYQCKVQQELSTRMLKFYMRRPYEFFVNTNSAEIHRGIDGDVIGVYEVIKDFMTLVSELITAILILISVFIMNIAMSIGMILIFSICICAILFGCRKIVKLTGIKARDAGIEKTKYAYQSINGIKEISVMQKYDYFLREYDEAYEKYRKAATRYYSVNLLPERIVEVILVCGIVSLVCVLNVFEYNATNYVAQLAAIAMACFRLMPSVNKLIMAINDMIYRMPEVQSLYENSLKAKEAEEQKQEETIYLKKILFKEELTINNISWHYANSERNILENVSLHIRKGQSIALIGESGAGKSTLVNIIMGLLCPQSGKILVDGIDITLLGKQRASLIGYVPQNVYLVDDTIRNNVAFGIERQDICDEDVWRALEEAELSLFVKELPDQLDTIVGERGIKFSGGQRQRIAIARALYYNPEILVLDEATSALDNETEKAVMESINSLMGIKTLIIVAHRLSTIQNCDLIYEVREGKVVKKERGNCS